MKKILCLVLGLPMALGHAAFMLETGDVRLDGFQKEEISALCRQRASDVLTELRAKDVRCCIQLPIFENS